MALWEKGGFGASWLTSSGAVSDRSWGVVTVCVWCWCWCWGGPCEKGHKSMGINQVHSSPFNLMRGGMFSLSFTIEKDRRIRREQHTLCLILLHIHIYIYIYIYMCVWVYLTDNKQCERKYLFHTEHPKQCCATAFKSYFEFTFFTCPRVTKTHSMFKVIVSAMWIWCKSTLCGTGVPDTVGLTRAIFNPTSSQLNRLSRWHSPLLLHHSGFVFLFFPIFRCLHLFMSLPPPHPLSLPSCVDSLFEEEGGGRRDDLAD